MNIFKTSATLLVVGLSVGLSGVSNAKGYGTVYCSPKWLMNCTARCTKSGLNMVPAEIQMREGYANFRTKDDSRPRSSWAQISTLACLCANDDGKEVGAVQKLCQRSRICNDGSFADQHGDCNVDPTPFPLPIPPFEVAEEGEEPFDSEEVEWQTTHQMPDWPTPLTIQHVPSGEPGVSGTTWIFTPYNPSSE